MIPACRTLPLIALLLTATPALACPTGKPIDIEWNGSMWPGVVLEGPNAAGHCLVSYDNYDDSWNEWVSQDRLGAVRTQIVGCPVGAALEIEWNGSFWGGSVLAGPNAEGQCLVTYDNYDSSWDEWVASGRLRATN